MPERIDDREPVMRLHPPRKGYRTLKRTFQQGGASGIMARRSILSCPSKPGSTKLDRMFILITLSSDFRVQLNSPITFAFVDIN
jgi:hypothetical protein